MRYAEVPCEHQGSSILGVRKLKALFLVLSRLLPFGTVPRKFYWVGNSILPASTCGVWVVYLRRCAPGRRSFPAILRLMKYSRSSSMLPVYTIICFPSGETAKAN